MVDRDVWSETNRRAVATLQNRYAEQLRLVACDGTADALEVIDICDRQLWLIATCKLPELIQQACLSTNRVLVLCGNAAECAATPGGWVENSMEKVCRFLDVVANVDGRGLGEGGPYVTGGQYEAGGGGACGYVGAGPYGGGNGEPYGGGAGTREDGRAEPREPARHSIVLTV